MRKVRRRDVLRWAACGAVSALGLGAFGTVSAANVVLERHTLRLPRWKADGFRLAVLSDLHSNHALAVSRARQAAELALAQQPDLIVLVGDFVNHADDSTLDLLESAIEPLSGAGCPIIGVLGNHDYWSQGPHRILDRIAAKSPIKMLRNSPLEVSDVTIAGIDDAIESKHRPGFVRELANSSLLVLLHEPDFVDSVPTNASLQISGHSHGGQICWPGGTPLHLPTGAKRYVRGFYPDAHVPLYVTRGVGTVGPQMRTFCPAEVSILTLRSAA